MRIYGLIGYPVKHSLSPLMHNAAFKGRNIDAEYRLFEVKPEELEDFLLSDIEVKDTFGNLVRTKDISGFNITIPHKVRAKEILENKFPYTQGTQRKPIQQDAYYVKLSGAINTVKREADQLLYWNTDANGFLRALKDELNFAVFDKPAKNVLVIGCGGAGRAVIAALSWKQTKVDKIYIYDTNENAVRGAKEHFFGLAKSYKGFAYLNSRLDFISEKDIPQTIKRCHLLVNASPVGMHENDPSVIDKKLLHKDLFVFDVVYNRQTQLVLDANNAGVKKTSGGLCMLLYQGVCAWELWTEFKLLAPVEVMRQALYGV